MFEPAFAQLFRAVDRVRVQLENASPELRPYLAQELRSLRQLSEQYIDYWMELEEQIIELTETFELQVPVEDPAPFKPESSIEPMWGRAQNAESLSLEYDPIADEQDTSEFDLAQAVFSWPEEATTQFRRGLAYYDLLMFEPARKALEEALKSVDSVIVHLYLGAVLAVEGQAVTARGHLEKVFEGTEDESLVTAALEVDAQLLLQHGDLGQACRSYQVITERMPEYLDAWFNLGLCQARLGNYKAAEQAFSQILVTDPRDIEACLLLSSVQQYSQCPEAAYQTCRFALDQNPSHPGLRLQQSRLLYQLGEHEASLEVALRLSDEDLHDQRVLSWAVWLQLKAGDSDAAIGRLKRFLSLHKNEPTVLLQLGVAHLLAGNPDMAEPILWCALPHSRDKSILWLALGAVSAARHQHLEAQKRFLRAVRDTRAPVRRLALYQYAMSLQALEQFEEADKYLHAAHILGSPNAAILGALADNALQLGRTEEAQKRRIQAQNLTAVTSFSELTDAGRDR
ncbi:tetratricopeptide repeat protein [Alicyclobacillus ferrooxydans]|uniref:tetratricopeptide repeat protein n=1 Tax=Alicyclobacillus ferrooxydans TaxID=471514 RepID=UPI0014706614|nr:tetratricopeptide repeat protein [Alicyclobacillus ferrooxydans]